MRGHMHQSSLVPGVVILVREGEFVAHLCSFGSMTEARSYASYLMRHHLLAPDVVAVAVREEDLVSTMLH